MTNNTFRNTRIIDKYRKFIWNKFKRKKHLKSHHDNEKKSKNFSTRCKELCHKCLIPTILNHQLSTSSCPKCGQVFHFSSAVFSLTQRGCGNDVNKKVDDTYMRKHLLQFKSKDFEFTPDRVLKLIKLYYDTLQIFGSKKVKNIRTSHIYNQIHKKYQLQTKFNRPDIMNRELKGFSVPLLSDVEIHSLITQRSILSNECLGRNDYSFKLYAYRIGVANGIECCRLFQPAKTRRIHQKKSHIVEKSFAELSSECMFQHVNLNASY